MSWTERLGNFKKKMGSIFFIVKENRELGKWDKTWKKERKKERKKKWRMQLSKEKKKGKNWWKYKTLVG